MSQLTSVIDLSAIAHNVRRLADLTGGAEIMAVVKADGYNHGAVPVAKTALRAGASQLGVATFEEAVELREAGIQAPVLYWLWSLDAEVQEQLRKAFELRIDVAVCSLAHAREVAKAAAEFAASGEVPRITVKVDSGLHRSGVPSSDWRETFAVLARAERAGDLHVTGLMSHLACADDPDSAFTDQQARAFQSAIDLAQEVGLTPEMNHLANTPAALMREDLSFQMIRPGLAVYGCEPIPGQDHGFRPAMTWQAEVVTVKHLEAGDGVSYGQTWTAEEPTWVAVVAAGYADGLPRALQGHLEVTIRGTRYPQVGRVCMDQFVVDLGPEGKQVAPGERATIFGPGNNGEQTADDLAEALGTINYEVLCSPRGRTVREYEQEEE